MCHQYGPCKSFGLTHTMHHCGYLKKCQLQGFIESAERQGRSSEEEREELEQLVSLWSEPNSEPQAVQWILELKNTKIPTTIYIFNGTVMLSMNHQKIIWRRNELWVAKGMTFFMARNWFFACAFCMNIASLFCVIFERKTAILHKDYKSFQWHLQQTSTNLLFYSRRKTELWLWNIGLFWKS